VVRRGIAMLEQVRVPILGIVENMSGFVTPEGQSIPIFGTGGGRGEAERRGYPFLGELPLYVNIREGGDRGVPIVVSAPESDAALAIGRIAEAMIAKLNKIQNK